MNFCIQVAQIFKIFFGKSLPKITFSYTILLVQILFVHSLNLLEKLLLLSNDDW